MGSEVVQSGSLAKIPLLGCFKEWPFSHLATKLVEFKSTCTQEWLESNVRGKVKGGEGE